MRKQITLVIVVGLTIVVAICVSIVAGRSKNVSSQDQQKVVRQDPAGTIDGAVNKELIPDQAAYGVFLRFAGHQIKTDKAILRSYLKSHGFKDEEVGVIQAMAEDFQKRVAVLDDEVKQIKDKNWPNPDSSVMARLSELQRQKETMVSEIINALLPRLNSDGQVRINHLLNDKIKTRMKIALAPPPPGSHGWHKKHH